VWMSGLELVDGFCYLGDMLGVGGDVDAAVEARIGVGSGSGGVSLVVQQLCARRHVAWG